VIAQGAWMSLAGVAAGAVASLVAARGLRGLLFGVEPWDPATLLGVGVLFAAIALAACLGPARRASRVDPMTTLRQAL
jgi:putative ABC transport system permease protein